MNRITCAVSLILLPLYVLATPQQTWQSIEQLMLRVHVVVFSKENIFDKQITAQETQQWNSMLEEARKEIANLTHGDQTITHALNSAISFGQDLLSTVKILYGTVFSPAAKPTPAKFTQAQQQLMQLSDKVKDVELYIKKMSGSTYVFNRSDKIEARKLLSKVLFPILESSVLKVQNDFNKLKKIRASS